MHCNLDNECGMMLNMSNTFLHILHLFKGEILKNLVANNKTFYFYNQDNRINDLGDAIVHQTGLSIFFVV